MVKETFGLFLIIVGYLLALFVGIILLFCSGLYDIYLIIIKKENMDFLRFTIMILKLIFGFPVSYLIMFVFTVWGVKLIND